MIVIVLFGTDKAIKVNAIEQYTAPNRTQRVENQPLTCALDHIVRGFAKEEASNSGVLQSPYSRKVLFPLRLRCAVSCER